MDTWPYNSMCLVTEYGHVRTFVGSGSHFWSKDGATLTRLLVAAEFIKIGGALGEASFPAVVYRVRGRTARFIPVAPKGGASVPAVLVKRIEIQVEGAQFGFVLLVVVRHTVECFKAGVLRRHSFAHHFDDGVRASDFDVFF